MPGYFDRLAKAMRPSRLGHHPLASIVLAAVVFVAIGAALPPLSSSGSVPDLGGDRSMVQVVPPEDLATFRTMSRWGTDIQSDDVQDATPNGASPGLNPELVKLGFIGLTLTAAENAVVLTHPDGHTIHLTDGDALPDGRTLASVTENALTLEDAKGEQETLVLFPRRPASDAND